MLWIEFNTFYHVYCFLEEKKKIRRNPSLGMQRNNGMCGLRAVKLTTRSVMRNIV